MVERENRTLIYWQPKNQRPQVRWTFLRQQTLPTRPWNSNEGKKVFSPSILLFSARFLQLKAATLTATRRKPRGPQGRPTFTLNLSYALNFTRTFCGTHVDILRYSRKKRRLRLFFHYILWEARGKLFASLTNCVCNFKLGAWPRAEREYGFGEC